MGRAIQTQAKDTWRCFSQKKPVFNSLCNDGQMIPYVANIKRIKRKFILKNICKFSIKYPHLISKKKYENKAR